MGTKATSKSLTPIASGFGCFFDQGVNMTELAERFHCSVSMISRELQNRRQRANMRTPAKEKAAAQPA